MLNAISSTPQRVAPTQMIQLSPLMSSRAKNLPHERHRFIQEVPCRTGEHKGATPQHCLNEDRQQPPIGRFELHNSVRPNASFLSTSASSLLTQSPAAQVKTRSSQKQPPNPRDELSDHSQIAKLLNTDMLLSDIFPFCDPGACQTILPDIPPLVDIEDSFNPYAIKSNFGLDNSLLFGLMQPSPYVLTFNDMPKDLAAPTKSSVQCASSIQSPAIDIESPNRENNLLDLINESPPLTEELHTLCRNQVSPTHGDVSEKKVVQNLIPKISDGQVCTNCGVNSTPLWRRSIAGNILCNACGVFERTHKRPRPPNPRSKLYKHQESKIVYMQSSSNGVTLDTTKCSNCTGTKTSLWRRSSDGKILCNACQLYRKLKGCDRPLALKSNIVRKRVRKIKKDFAKESSMSL